MSASVGWPTRVLRWLTGLAVSSAAALAIAQPLAWTASISVPGASAVRFAGRHAAAVDAAGHAFVVGTATIGEQDDLLVARVDPDGTIAWIRTFDGRAHGDDEGTALALAGDGGVYAAGTTTVGAGRHVIVRRYDASGALAWSTTYDTGNPFPTVSQVLVDSAGHAFVAAGEALISLDATGAFRFARSYALSLGELVRSGSGLALSGYGATPDGQVHRVVRIDQDGVPGQTLQAPGSNILNNGPPTALAIGPSGEIVVAGGFLVAAWDAAGQFQWSDQFASFLTPNSGCACRPYAVAIDSSGHVTVTGTSFSFFRLTLVTKHYDAAGHVLWQDISSELTGSGGFDVAVDARGDALVAGRAGDTVEQLALFRYTAGGARSALATAGQTDHNDQEGAVALADGAVYTVGNGDVSGLARIVVARYGSVTAGPAEVASVPALGTGTLLVLIVLVGIAGTTARGRTS